jgi:hypothetical protein
MNIDIKELDNRITKSNNHILQTLSDRLAKHLVSSAAKKAIEASEKRIEEYLTPIHKLFSESQIKKLSIWYAGTSRAPTLLGFSRFCRNQVGTSSEDLDNQAKHHYKKIQSSWRFEEVFGG